MPGAIPINDDVTGAGHLHKDEDCEHSHLGLKIKSFECPMGPRQIQKTLNTMSNCLFALGPYISPMTNVLLTDLSLSIPLKLFFESFIDKCFSMSVDSAIY